MKEKTELKHGSRNIYKLPVTHVFLSIMELILLFLFSYIIPKNKNLLIFGNGQGKFKGNPKYFFLHMQNKKYECIYFSDNKKVIQNLTKKGYKSINKKSFKSKILLLRAKYIFVDGGWGDVSRDQFIGNFNVVNLWHGDPIKKINYDDKQSLFYSKNPIYKIIKFIFDFQYKTTKFFITKSKFSQKHIQSAFRTKKVKITGYPLTDSFFDKNINKETIINKAINSKNKPKKIFLYAPTFREEKENFNPFSEKFLKELNLWLKEKNYYFLIKKHPMEKSFIIKNKTNIIDVTSKKEDIQELLLITDVLISDYSSVFFDFTVQEKPIIIYNFDEEHYITKSRDLYYDINKELPGPFCKNEKELIETMKKIDKLFSEKKYQEKYEQYNKKFNKHLDGNSYKRICEELGL